MKGEVGNWIGEGTVTVGTGSVVMGGPLNGHAAFSNVPDGLVWYAIIDGDNREAGYGTLSSGGSLLLRDGVAATLEAGVYTDTAPSPLNLSGGAQIYSTFNSAAFRIITSLEGDTLTGPLLYNGAPVDPDEYVNKTYADSILISINDHINEVTGAHTASAITNVPSGTLVATDVQAAVDELEANKADDTDVSDVAADLNDHIISVTAHESLHITYDPPIAPPPVVRFYPTSLNVQEAMDEIIANMFNWMICNDGEDFPDNPPTAAFERSIAIGRYSNALGQKATAIGFIADATQDGVAIGSTVSAIGGGSSIAIGNQSIVDGIFSIAIGAAHNITADYTVVIGYGAADTDKNVLELKGKGRLTTYGEQAAFVIPGYLAASPPVGVDGALTYANDTKQLRFYDGAAWISLAAGSIYNWMICNNGADFDYPSVSPGLNSIAIGRLCEANGARAIAIGHFATCEEQGVSIGEGCQANAENTIAIGFECQTYWVAGEQIGGVAIGTQAYSYAKYAITIGTWIQNDDPYSILMGVREGGAPDETNVLSVKNRGRLSLEGDQAAFIVPGYLAASPPVSIEGALTYTSDTKILKYYDGAAWIALGASSSFNWLTANNGADFGIAPNGSGANAIALGRGATATREDSICIGTFADTDTSTGEGQIAIGVNSVCSGSFAIALGADAASSADRAVAIGQGVSGNIANSARIGVQSGAEKTIIHSKERGRLYLEGSQAAYILPGYLDASPPIGAEGGLIYITDTKVLKFFDGAVWAEIGGTVAAEDVTFTPAGTIASTDVQGAIEELDADVVQNATDIGTVDTDLTNHLNDTVDAHDASAISNIPSGTVSSTTVQGAIDELAVAPFVEGYIQLDMITAYNVDGGTYTTVNIWQRFPINTETADTQNNCVLSGNQFTLDAGTYEMTFIGSYRSASTLSSFSKGRLYNVTDAAVELDGMANYNKGDDTLDIIVAGRFTIAAAKEFRFDLIGSRAQVDSGFGLASDIASHGDNRYLTAIFRKKA